MAKRKPAANLGTIAGEETAPVVPDATVFLSPTLKWEVQLDILPTMIVEAATEQDAIDAYFSMNGVISSEKRVNTKRLPAT